MRRQWWRVDGGINPTDARLGDARLGDARLGDARLGKDSNQAYGGTDMASKKSNSSVPIGTRLDAIIEDVRSCLLECAEQRAECLSGCPDDQVAGRKCRIACYKANALCTRKCRRNLEEIESLLLAEIAREAGS